MSKINTNVPSLIAQRVLGKNNQILNTSLERLSTGLRINRGSDDPAGLIASENLRAERAGIEQAIDNAERASNLVGTAEGGLAEVSSLLQELQSLVTEAANSGGLSAEEIDANQQQVDSILNTINRLANNVQFNGKKLLDGSLAYTTSGISDTQFDNVRINSARLSEGAELNVVVNVVASGQLAAIDYSLTGTLSAPVTIEVAGVNGTEQISFASGTSLSGIQAAVNNLSDATGVSASIASGGGTLSFNSTAFGSSQYVTVRAISGSFTTSSSSGTEYGTDAAVTINGNAAEVDGISVKLRTNQLDIEFDLDKSFNVPGSSSFYVTGGGANFQLGQKVTAGAQKSIGLNAVTVGNLGNSTLGYLSSLASGKDNDLNSGNLSTAQKILDRSIKQVSDLRGRLGAFQKFELGSTVNSLGVALENISAAESAIRDTNFAEETANLTRAQILASASQSVLAQANAAPQSALSLLR
jgi:flagellin